MDLINEILSGSRWVWITIAIVGALAVAMRVIEQW
jgi:hypothetical protein